MFCVYLTEKMLKDSSLSPLRKYPVPISTQVMLIVKKDWLLFSSFRLVFAKLKLLMIAIEYKSEKRESRYVLYLQILTFWNALLRILAHCFFLPHCPNGHSYSFETFQIIISMPPHYIISYNAKKPLFLPCCCPLKLIPVRTFSGKLWDSDTYIQWPELQFIFTLKLRMFLFTVYQFGNELAHIEYKTNRNIG